MSFKISAAYDACKAHEQNHQVTDSTSGVVVQFETSLPSTTYITAALSILDRGGERFQYPRKMGYDREKGTELAMPEGVFYTITDCVAATSTGSGMIYAFLLEPNSTPLDLESDL